MRNLLSRMNLIVVLALSGVSCRKPISPALSQPFDLHAGQAARPRGSDLELYFRRVAADSRCPRGVQCITAGEAVVTLDARILQGYPETFEVRLEGASSDSLKEAIYQGYGVRLLSLEPSPVAGATTDTTAYVGRFIVRKR
jgi:hypothetical protein